MLAAVTGCQNQAANVTANRSNAEQWVKSTLPGYELIGFNSATLDSDGDGYITCDISVRKSEDIRLLQLDCPTTGNPFSFQKGGGCKFKQSPYHDVY